MKKCKLPQAQNPNRMRAELGTGLLEKDRRALELSYEP